MGYSQEWFISIENALIEMLKFINPDKGIVTEFLQSPYYKHLLYLKEIVS